MSKVYLILTLRAGRVSRDGKILKVFSKDLPLGEKFPQFAVPAVPAGPDPSLFHPFDQLEPLPIGLFITDLDHFLPQQSFQTIQPFGHTSGRIWETSLDCLLLSSIDHPDIKPTIVGISERTGLTVSQVTDEVPYTGLIEMQELDATKRIGPS